jgi:hypothetical protein
MSDGELKFPEWQEPLRDVILEFDPEQLREKLPKVEMLIFERLQQLRYGPDGHDEEEAINDALRVLQMLRREKLGSA